MTNFIGFKMVLHIFSLNLLFKLCFIAAVNRVSFWSIKWLQSMSEKTKGHGRCCYKLVSVAKENTSPCRKDSLRQIHSRSPQWLLSSPWEAKSAGDAKPSSNCLSRSPLHMKKAWRFWDTGCLGYYAHPVGHFTGMLIFIFIFSEAWAFSTEMDSRLHKRWRT